MKLTELALCVFGGYARGIYFDIKNGKIENIYAEYSQRLLQNAIYVDEKVKYENGYATSPHKYVNPWEFN